MEYQRLEILKNAITAAAKSADEIKEDFGNAKRKFQMFLRYQKTDPKGNLTMKRRPTRYHYGK